MKYYLAIGGFLGCFLAFSSALLAGNSVIHALLTAAIGCVAGAVLLKGFYSALLWCAQDASEEKAHRHENGAHEARNVPAGKTNGSK